VRVERRYTRPASDAPGAPVAAYAGKWGSVVWQEEDGAAGEVRIEIGLARDLRVVLDLEDLEHLSAVIRARTTVDESTDASEDYA
jgi:hypothetical protein